MGKDDTIPLSKNKAARRATSAQQLALRPAKHPGVYRATAAQCPSSCRETSHAIPMNVRAMVGATARKCLGNCRWSPHSKSRSRSLGRHEASGLASGWQVTKRTVGVREAVRATTRVMSGNASAQYPAQLPGNCRESAEQCPGNILCGVPRIIHAVSNESSGCLCQATVERCPGNVQAMSTQQSRLSPLGVHATSANSVSPCPCPIREPTVAATCP
jgi:hypothetical protein